MNLSTQAQGLLITTAGVLAISPDTLLVRLLSLERWSLIFYRGIIISICLFILTAVSYKRDTINQFRSIGFPGIAIALMFTASNICFVSSLYYTNVANTLVILSGSSMFGALFSRLFLKESIPLRTFVTMIIVIGSISYIVSDSLGGGTLLGDLFAVLAAMLMAGVFTMARRSRSCNMIPATAMSGLFTALVAFFPARFTLLDQRAMLLLACLGLVLAIAFALLTIGPRYISAPEVSLLMQIETVLGPLFIWLILHERPTNSALIGGAVVILTLTVHSFLGLRTQARPID